MMGKLKWTYIINSITRRFMVDTKMIWNCYTGLEYNNMQTQILQTIKENKRKIKNMVEDRHTYYVHALKSYIRKLKVHYILPPNHLWRYLLKQVIELHAFSSAGMEFQMDVPEKEKLVLERSILGLGNIIAVSYTHLTLPTRRWV